MVGLIEETILVSATHATSHLCKKMWVKVSPKLGEAGRGGLVVTFVYKNHRGLINATPTYSSEPIPATQGSRCSNVTMIFLPSQNKPMCN